MNGLVFAASCLSSFTVGLALGIVMGITVRAPRYRVPASRWESCPQCRDLHRGDK